MQTVSVAMATYNGAAFIRDQLDSIARQTQLPAELVVTDDASTDDTLGVVREFARAAPFPVRIYENPTRLGYRANFMRNVDLCTSQIVALCDQDDVWDDMKLERALQTFLDPDILLCHHESYLIDQAGARTGLANIYPLPERTPPLKLFPMRNPFGFAMLFRRDLLTFSDLWKKSVDNLETTSRMAHDQWFFWLASVFGTTAYIDQPLASYRQHANNTYGVGRPAPTFLHKAGQWLKRAADENAGFSVAASARASILIEAQARLDHPWRARAEEGIVSYQVLARHCALRSLAYGDARMMSRLNAWRSMIREGAYGRNVRWPLGREMIVVDLFCLLLPKPLINAGLAIWRRRIRHADRQHIQQQQQRVDTDRAFGEEQAAEAGRAVK